MNDQIFKEVVKKDTATYFNHENTDNNSNIILILVEFFY